MERRARALPGEYMAKARDVDRRFCGIAEGDVGPFERRLRNFEPVNLRTICELNSGHHLGLAAHGDREWGHAHPHLFQFPNQK